MSRAGTKGPYTVITNGHERPIVNGWETTAEERADLDYVDWAAVEAGNDSWSGVRYRGNLYDLNDTEGLAPDDLRFLGWDVWLTDSAFSATVFCHHDKDGEYLDETVIVGRVYT